MKLSTRGAPRWSRFTFWLKPFLMGRCCYCCEPMKKRACSALIIGRRPCPACKASLLVVWNG